MSFQNYSFGQLTRKTTNSQERKVLTKSNNTLARKSIHERSGSLGEKSLLQQTRHIKQNSLSKLNDQVEDILLPKPLPNDPANELQGNLMEFVTGKVSTYLAEVRSFVSNTFERISLLEHGSDIQELLQNFKARKAFIDEQTQQMERSVLKFNFAFNSQKNLQIRQNDDPLVVKRFYSGQESSNSSQKQDVSNQKLEDIVSYLSQKNNFLLNRLQSSPVRATRIDVLSTESEKISSRTSIEPRIFKSRQQSLTAQSSQKDLLQQIDCLGFINEIKGLKLQNKDLLTDLKNIQEKYKEVIRENDFLRNDNKTVWQDLDETKSLYEIEKQMHLESKRLFNIKKSSPERTKKNHEDMQNMLKKFEEDNLILDQLRKELKTLQEKFTNQKVEGEQINSFLKDINKSLTNIRSQQDFEVLLEAFGSEIEKLLKAVKSLDTAKSFNQNLDILRENFDFIMKKIKDQQKQDFTLSEELLKIIQIIQKNLNNDIDLDNKELNNIKVVSVLRQKLENLIQNISLQMKSVQHLNAELLEKLNLKETELRETASNLQIHSDEMPKKIEICLKNQMQKVLRQINENLGSKNSLDDEEEDLEALEKRVDRICQEFQSMVDSLKKGRDAQILELLEVKNKLEQEIQTHKTLALAHRELEKLQKNKDKQIQDLSIALEKTTKRFEENKFEKDDLNRKIQDQTESIEQLNAEMESLKQELRKIKELYDSEVGKREALKTQLEKNLSQKNQETYSLETKLEKKENEISNLEVERKNVALLLQSLESENFKVKEHLEDLEKQLIQYSSEKAALSGEFNKSQKEIETNTELYQQALTEIEQLKLQKSERENRVKHVEEKNQILATSLDDSESHVKTLKEELSVKETELNKIQLEIKSVQDQRVSSEEAIFELSKKFDALRALKEELESEHRKNQTANGQLRKEIEILENHFKEEQGKRIASEETLSREMESMRQQVKEKVASLHTQLKEKNEEIISSETRFKDTLSNLLKESDALKAFKKEQEIELDKMQRLSAQEVNDLKQGFEKEIESLKLRLEEKENQRISLDRALSDLSKELEEKTAEFNQIQTSKAQGLESLKTQIKLLEDEKASSKTIHEETVAKISKQLATVTASKDELQTAIENAKAQFKKEMESLESRLKEEHEIQLNKSQSLNAQEIKKMKQEFEKNVELLETKLKEKKTEFESLKIQIKQIEDDKTSSKTLQEETLTKLSKDLATMTTSKDELQIELNTTRATFENAKVQLRKQIETLESRLKEEQEMTAQEMESLKLRLEEKENQRIVSDRTLSKELEEKNIEFDKLQALKTQEIESLKTQLREVESEKVSSKSLSSELAAMMTLKNELEIELNTTRATFENAKVQFKKEIESLESRLKEEQEVSAQEMESLKIQLAEKETQRIVSDRTLSKELEEKNIEFDKLQALKTQEIESLKTQLKEFESEQASSKSLQEENLAKLSKELATVTASKDELQTAVENAKVQFKKEMESLESQLKEEKEKSAQEMESLKLRLEEKENQRISLDRALSDLSKELEGKTAEFNQIQTLKAQELESLKSLTKQLQNEKASSKTLHEETVAKILKDLTTVTASKDELQTELNKTQNTMEKTRIELRKEIETLENRFKEEQDRRVSSENLSKESNSLRVLKEEEFESLKLRLEERENQRILSDKTLSHLSKELEEKTIEFNKIELANAQFKKDIEALEEQAIVSKQLNEELKMKIDQIEISNAQEVESLKLQLEEEENKIISSEAFFEEQTNIHNETVANLSNELATLKLLKNKELNEVEHVQQKFEKEIESLQTQMREEQNKRISSEETLTQLSKEFATLKELEQKAATTVNIQEKFEKEIESLEVQLREEKDKRISAEALYEEENKIHEETVLELSKGLEALKGQRSTPQETTETQTDFDLILAQRMVAFLEAFVQQTLQHTKTIYQGIESTTARDAEFAFYTAFKEIIESNHNMINKLSDIKLLELNLQDHEPAAVLSEIFGKLNQSLEQNQKAKNLCNDLERISCAGSPISLQLHRMRSYQEENHSAVYDPRNLDMSGSISKFESSFMDIAAQHGADLEDSSSQKDEAMKSLESKIDILNMSHQKIAEENNLLKRNVETTSKVQGQLRIANDKFAIEYDKLVEELKDRETDEERFALQIKILKKELEETRTRLSQSEGANEREHLKKILVKFLDTIFRAKQTKETAEMLKIICSMLFCSEAEKNKLLELFNRSIPKKSNSLLKVFS